MAGWMAFLNGLVQGQITQNMPSHLGRIPSTCSENLSGLYVHDSSKYHTHIFAAEKVTISLQRHFSFITGLQKSDYMFDQKQLNFCGDL